MTFDHRYAEKIEAAKIRDLRSKSDLSSGLVAAVVDWANSEEGQRELAESKARVRKTLEWLAEERRLAWEQLNTPMTI